MFLVPILTWLIILIPRAICSSPYVVSDDLGTGRIFDGIGGLSAGATSKLLINYKEPQRSQILDYLFKPKFGASFQILKVEIGGDDQSTDGTEASHMHEEWDENYNRGYEWWLMKEAKKRKPSIKLSGLSWTWPHFLGDAHNEPYKNLTKTALYTVKWILGAKNVHGLTIDYIGIWNERNCNPDYILTLRKMLDKYQLQNVQIIASDGGWDDFGPYANNKTLQDSVYAYGVHYPGTTAPSVAVKSNVTLWSSEDYSTFNDEVGAGCWARILNQNYVNGYMTSTTTWALIASYYFGLPYEGDGLMTAVQPWSGYYEVKTPIWITAHTTQFTEIGWKYLKHGYGVGLLEKGGSYVSLVSPDSKQLTLIIETMVVQGRVALSLDVDSLYTLTTITDAKHGDYGDTSKSSGFPLPYEDNFQNYSENEEPYYLSPQVGSWEIVKKSATDSQQFVRQIVMNPPVWWCDVNLYPVAVIGNPKWQDINVTATMRMPSVNGTDSVFVGLQTQLSSGCQFSKSTGIFFSIDKKFSSYVISRDLIGNNILDTGLIGVKLQSDKWYTLNVVIKGVSFNASIDGVLISSLNLPARVVQTGFVSIGSGSFGYSDIRHLALSIP